MTMRAVNLVSIFLAGALISAQADTVVFHDGQRLDGTFLSGTARQIQFLDKSGKTHTVAIEHIKAINFAAPPPPPPKPKPPATKQFVAATVPAGTTISVRLIDPINVDVAKAGQTFKASVDDPVMMSGKIVIPRGADVLLQCASVKQAGKFKGSDEIGLKINSISFAGKRFEVATDVVTEKGASEGKKTARRTLGVAGLGAAIGGIAGGGSGAAIGAVAGAGVGAAASAGGQSLKIPSETRLQFNLAAAVNIH